MSNITLEESVRNGLVEYCKEREMIGATIFDENGNIILNQGFEQTIPAEQLKYDLFFTINRILIYLLQFYQGFYYYFQFGRGCIL